MIEIDGLIIRNALEQIEANKDDIKTIKQSLGKALPDPIPGPTGPQGPQGSIIYIGSGIPQSNPTRLNEHYINNVNGAWYSSKNSGDAFIWEYQFSIRGPQGQPGKQGNTGLKGTPGEGLDTLSEIDLSIGTATVVYVDKKATVANSGTILYDATEKKLFNSKFDIPIAGDNLIHIDANEAADGLEVKIDETNASEGKVIGYSGGKVQWITLRDYPLEKAKIYGVSKVGSESPTLTRTYDAVGLTYQKLEDGNIRSDFDNAYPWSDITEVTDSSGNVFMRIPKFYYRLTPSAVDLTFDLEISGVRHDGFKTLFEKDGIEFNYIDIGKYEASLENGNKLVSKSKKNIMRTLAQGQARNYCKANGEGYQLYDYISDQIIRFLFYVEFATTDSQSIMRGVSDADNPIVTTGETDSIISKSGSVDNNDGLHSFKYRGIENIYGNFWHHCDGVLNIGNSVYLCKDPSKYTYGDGVNVPAGYFKAGDRKLQSGYISEINTFNSDTMLNVFKVDGTAASFYADYFYAGSGYCGLLVGGYANYGDANGITCRFTNTLSSYQYVASRLCKRPD